jgi:hypothetical protein
VNRAPTVTVVCLVVAAVAGACGRTEHSLVPEAPRSPEAVLHDYLDAVESQDYRAAAELLAAGEEPLDARRDLDPLAVEGASVAELAAGLADYCRDGCLAATDIALADAAGSEGRAVVQFGEPRGHPLERTFTVGRTEDGDPYVRGLPPSGTGSLYTPR